MTPSTPNIPLPSLPSMPDAASATPTFLGAQMPKPRKSATPSFLGIQDRPSQANAGWKTLIGT